MIEVKHLLNRFPDAPNDYKLIGNSGEFRVHDFGLSRPNSRKAQLFGLDAPTISVETHRRRGIFGALKPNKGVET